MVILVGLSRVVRSLALERGIEGIPFGVSLAGQHVVSPFGRDDEGVGQGVPFRL